MFSLRIILTYSVLVLLLTASFNSVTRAESTTPSVQTSHENVLTATDLPPVFLSPKKFRFVAFGDYQKQDGGIDTILKNLETSPVKPDFYVNTGDIQTVPFPGFDQTNKRLYGKKLYPAKGNNDANIWENISGQSKDYYSFSYGNTHFVMLYSGTDDNSPATQFPEKSPNLNCDTPAPVDQTQTDWLYCDLEKVRNNATIDNIIVVLHMPPLTFGDVGTHPSSVPEYERLVPILKTHPKLRAVLSGHNHFYQRLIKDNINFFVIGGGGAPLYPTLPFPVSSTDPNYHPEIQNQAKQYHFAIFDIDGSKVTVSVVGYIPKVQGFKTIETLDLGCITGVRKILCQNVKRVDIDEDCSTTLLP